MHRHGGGHSYECPACGKPRTLPAILVRHTTIILFLLFCQNLFGQIKFGTYSQIDTSVYADLKLYSDNKFDFYDTRNGSCWVWTRTLGNWKLKKDTVIFSWQSTSEESSDSFIGRRDLNTKNVEITFLYDNGIPIPSVEVSLSCLFDRTPKKYITNNHGKVTIPQKGIAEPNKKMCVDSERMLDYEIKNKIVKLSARTSLDYSIDSLDNVIKIIIKRNPKTTHQTETKKYLIRGNTLIDIDPKGYYNYNWGDFKFSTYGR